MMLLGCTKVIARCTHLWPFSRYPVLSTVTKSKYQVIDQRCCYYACRNLSLSSSNKTLCGLSLNNPSSGFAERGGCLLSPSALHHFGQRHSANRHMHDGQSLAPFQECVNSNLELQHYKHVAPSKISNLVHPRQFHHKPIPPQDCQLLRRWLPTPWKVWSLPDFQSSQQLQNCIQPSRQLGHVRHYTQFCRAQLPLKCRREPPSLGQVVGWRQKECAELFGRGQIGRGQILGCSSRRSMSLMTSVVNSAPSKIQPYMKLMRIDKPIGK